MLFLGFVRGREAWKRWEELVLEAPLTILASGIGTATLFFREGSSPLTGSSI